MLAVLYAADHQHEHKRYEIHDPNRSYQLIPAQLRLGLDIPWVP